MPYVERVFVEYKQLIVKMLGNATIVVVARPILTTLLNIQNLLALPLLMSMLRSLNYLVKLAQARDTYIVDYVAIVKSCQDELFYFHVCFDTKFCLDNFRAFEDIIANQFENVILV